MNELAETLTNIHKNLPDEWVLTLCVTNEEMWIHADNADDNEVVLSTTPETCVVDMFKVFNNVRELFKQ